jgi:hypothetical protein
MRPDDRMEAMKSMNFRRIFFLGALVGLGFAAAAQAQFAAYGMVNGERLKDIVCVDPRGCASTTSTPVLTGQKNTADPYGGTIGAFYDFRSFGPVTLGADVRAVFLNTNKAAYAYQASSAFMRHDSFLGGARLTFKTPFKVLRPYAQISAGLGRTDATDPPLPLAQPPGKLNYKNFTQVQGFAGIDLALWNNVDFRPIEFGYGEMFGSGSHTLESIGIGIVFHTSRNR